MVVMGIDPGTASTGYGVVSSCGNALNALACGVVRTSPDSAPAARLAEIFTEVGGLLDAHRPDALAIEELFFGQNVRTAFAVGQGRGVVLAAAGLRDVPCASYTPQQVKSAVCGSGRADKAQVQTMVGRLLGPDVLARSDHAADALAVALCHVNRAPLAAALARA